MKNMFEGYDLVVIDASCFRMKGDISDFRESLAATTLMASRTFFAEWNAYGALLPEDSRKMYGDLLDYLIECRPQTLQYNSRDVPMDTWEMIQKIPEYRPGSRFAVVTGNQILMERIILSDSPPIETDIFDVSTGTWLRGADFPALRPQFELERESPREDSGQVAYSMNLRTADGEMLYKSTGGTVTLHKLDKEIARGGAESEIFRAIDDEGHEFIAKLFKPRYLRIEKFAHLRRMIEVCREIHAPWIPFPTALLSLDADGNNPVGILEPYVKNCHPVYSEKLHRGRDPDSADLTLKFSDVLRFCRCLVAQVLFLNHYGFFVSDCNFLNFAISPDYPGRVMMFDSDSFGYGSFFSELFDGNNSLSRNHNTDLKAETLDYCDDALYVLVFDLLALGTTPIQAENGRRLFKFDNPYFLEVYKKNLFPRALWNIFQAAFHGKTPLSTPLLLWALKEAENDIQKSPEKDFLYEKKLEELKAEPEPPPENDLQPSFWKNLTSGVYDWLLVLLAIGAVVGLALLYFTS